MRRIEKREISSEEDQRESIITGKRKNSRGKKTTAKKKEPNTGS
jgi:hypothetical protein